MWDIPDPDSFIGQLEGSVYRKLLQKLRTQQSWRRIASEIPIFVEEELELETCPSTTILNELVQRQATVDDLRRCLWRCQLHEAAALFTEPYPLVIDRQPGDGDDDEYVPYGGELSLEVVARGVPPPRYSWYWENEELLDQRSSSLSINDFGPDKEGEYKCLVTQDGVDGYYQMFTIPVSVKMLPEPPTIQEQPEPVSVRIGQEIVLNCRAASHPPPTYEWIHENTVLIGENDPVLRIPSASMGHDGTYKCCISNGYDERITDTIRVSVYESPLVEIVDRTELPIVQEKVALLIANANYKNMDPLNTPYNDAKALSAALTKLGFKVLALCDLNLTEMVNAVKIICDLLPEDSYAFFYFVGHGFEFHGKYMLPVDCPKPDTYLRSDSMCEELVIKEVLAKKPRLLVMMLDMCLKLPKSEENPGILDERIYPIPYAQNAQRNLIQAYATTSNMGAYERPSDKNGIYMTHLLKFLCDDMPILEILQKVNRSVAEEKTVATPLQMPSFTTNVVSDLHYLTVGAHDNPETRFLYDKLTHLQPDFEAYFKEIKRYASLKFRLYEDCFHNGMEIHIYNLQDLRLSFETQSTDLWLMCELLENRKVLKVFCLQKLKTPSLPVTISLSNARKELVDNAFIDFKEIPITFAYLWFQWPLMVDERDDAALPSLSYDSSVQSFYSGNDNAGTPI